MCFQLSAGHVFLDEADAPLRRGVSAPG
jgi:hypothetical protein